MTELLLLPALAQDDHAYDLVGMPSRTALYPGTGTRPPEPVTLWGIADEIAATLAEPVDIAGVALGGIIGQYLLIRHPDLVRSALLANTPSSVGDPTQLYQRAEEARRDGVAAMADTLVARWFRQETIAADGPGVRYIREQIAALPSEGFSYMQRAMAQTDTAAALPGVTAPVTLLQASDDPVGPGSVARIHELLQRSRLVEIPGSHMVHLDNPEGFRRALEDHLAWVDAGAPID